MRREKCLMEIQLQDLIEQIKKDGVASAEMEADEILNAAKAEAAKIISDAQVQAVYHLCSIKKVKSSLQKKTVN